MQDFTKIRAWSSGKDFFVSLFDITKNFPCDERFGFTSQMRRSARSICANIAEGCGYTGNQDTARYYQMAFGSSSECYSDMHLAKAISYLSSEDFEKLESLLVPTRKQLYRLIGAIRSRG